jgi:hypothetical protein
MRWRRSYSSSGRDRCGQARCWICHPNKRWYGQSERTRQKREWRRIELELAY